jgi:hypothetical protein
MSAMLLVILAFSCTSFNVHAQDRQYIQLRVYHARDSVQLKEVNKYLQEAYVPALHKAGHKMIGVFTNMANDTALDKRIYLIIPFASIQQLDRLNQQLEKDKSLEAKGSDYVVAGHDKAPYVRFENIMLRCFELMPQVSKTQLNGNIKERVYELRSYESPTENYFKSKVKMFNQGGEIALFKRLGFNALFYSEVVFGSHMPNLMYMTSFENMEAREKHWQIFGNDPVWKKLSSMPEYQNNVSHINIDFLRTTAYSDL